MNTPFQFLRAAVAGPYVGWRLLAALLLAVVLLGPLAAAAQNAPQGAMGRVEGKDVTVESGSAAGSGTSTSAPSIYVSNGSIVTMHSGQGRLVLFGGGEVEICGPAKFTVLLSGDSITLALNFGRLRVQLPEKTTLQIFTPTIVGTPLGISGTVRDVTVGLSLDDSLCVVAASGAIQLEHQFTGEKLIVPQAGEFFLNEGRLLPVAGTPGTCQCVEPKQQVVPAPAGPPPEFAAAVAVPPALPSAPPAALTPDVTAAPVPGTAPAPTPSVEFSIPADANEKHPILPPKDTPAVTPPTESAYTVVMPPLVFSASSPTRPVTEAPSMILLIREAQVSPEWQFSGHVQPPEFAREMQRALGERQPASEPNQEPSNQPRQDSKGRSGFWGALRRIFGGR